MGFIETLIGQNMSMHPDCLGVYISVDEIYVAQTARKDGSTVLESLVRVPVEVEDKTKLKPLELNEAFFTMGGWLETLTKITKRKKWKTNKVVVSLAPSFCLLRHFVINGIGDNRKDWKQTVPFEARKYIQYPFDKAEYAYHVYNFETSVSKKKSIGVVFALTSKLIIEQLQKGCKTAGLELVSVEPSGFSLGRTFNDSDKEAVGNVGRIYSFFGKSAADFVFVHENLPVLLREVEISGALPVERRRFEITNCTEFIAKQLERDPFTEAVLFGKDVEQWRPALEADSKKPVRKWNLSEVFGIETTAAGEIAAVGASIKFYDTKTPDVDLTKGNRLSSYEFNASLTAWEIVGVVLLVIFGLIGKGYFSVKSMEKDYKRNQAQVAQVPEALRGLSAGQIQSNLSKMQSQITALQGLEDIGHLATPLLEELFNIMPAEMWITKISYSDSMKPARGGEDSRSLQIEGLIKTDGKDGRADMAIGNHFKELAMQQANLKKICAKDINIVFPQLAGTKAESGNARGISGSVGLAKETQFQFTCSAANSGVGGQRNGR